MKRVVKQVSGMPVARAMKADEIQHGVQWARPATASARPVPGTRRVQG